MLGSLASWLPFLKSDSPSRYCSREFPQVYSEFLDSLFDTIYAQQPIAPPLQRQAARTFLPAVPRIVAIGDLHGDWAKTQRAFRLGGLIDDNDRWAGGTTTAVQVGDQLDRGDNELRILYFLERLQKEALEAGGALHVLNGNHETMNVEGRFRYSTALAIQDFFNWDQFMGFAAAMKAKCGCQEDRPAWRGAGAEQEHAAVRARQAALTPGGPATVRFLADHPIVLQIGSTVFVHGGVLPQHAEYGVERINAETREWMLGRRPQMPQFLGGRDAVVWAREYSTEEARRCNCTALQEALARMGSGAERMVVGHTIQARGINSACGDQVFRIDIGLSQGCGDGPPQVLEILDDKEVRLLSERLSNEPLAKPADTEHPAHKWSWRDVLGVREQVP